MVSSLFGVQWQKMSLNILKAIYPELYKIRQLSKWVDANSLQVCYNHVVFRHCSARMIIVVLHILTWQSKKSFSRYCVCVCVWEREREWFGLSIRYILKKEFWSAVFPSTLISGDFSSPCNNGLLARVRFGLVLCLITNWRNSSLSSIHGTVFHTAIPRLMQFDYWVR